MVSAACYAPYAANGKCRSLETMGEIVSQDIGMTVRILQLINSTIFNSHRHIPGPDQAVVSLGLGMFRTLISTAGAFSSFDQAVLENLQPEMIWDHSVIVGKFARQITRCESAEQKSVDSVFVAGLLHDVGKLVLAAALPEEYGSAVALASNGGIGGLEAEREIFGSTHAEVGAYLLGLWGLTDSIVEATALHHSPVKSPEKEFSPLTAVYVADILEAEACSTEKIYITYLAGLGLNDFWYDK